MCKTLNKSSMTDSSKLVIPKEHKERFHQLSEESLVDILPTAQKVVKALNSATNTDDYNILQVKYHQIGIIRF